jgi:periplasmic divalent cation tolerance protein
MLKLIQTAVTDRQQADRLAGLLVERKLAACVQSCPITSTYRWQGKIEQGSEILLLIKTTATRVAALRDALEREHPYKVPEIITMDVDDVSGPYADWAEEQTKASE